MKSFYSFKKFLLTGLLLTFFSLGWSQTLLVENFEYTAGAALLDNNWLIQSTTTTNPLLIADGGLTYTGYSGSDIGNALAMMNTGQDAFLGFEKQMEGVLYMSVLVNVSAATTGGDYFISFKESSTSESNSNYRGRLRVMADASNNLAFGISEGSGTVVYTDFVYSLNTTYLIVIKYTINPLIDDVCDVFINPVIGDSEPLPTISSTDSSSYIGLGSVLVRQGGSSTGATLTVDGIRVAQSWAHALPVAKFIISEVADPKDNSNARFVELFNSGALDIDFGASVFYLAKQSNAGSFSNFQLQGVLKSDSTLVVATNIANFTTAYGFAPDMEFSSLTGNGNDGYFIYKDGDNATGTLYDAYGAVDTDGLGTAWDYTDKRAVRVPGTVDPNAVWTASEWTILAANVADFDPGVYTSIAPPDATLSDLTIDAVTVGSFNAAITSYTVVLPAGTTTVPTVAYTLNDAGATASQVDATDLAGDASARTTTITVTAEDGLTTLDYTILFNPILEVATIADLRAVTDLDRTYTVTGEVVLTHQDGFRNKKYLEDATGAIEVDDVLTGNFDPGVITTVYNVGDGITGLTGVLEDYYGYLQFHPSVNPGEATSNINAVEPQVITVSEFTSNFDTYASEFVKIVGVSFADGGSTFGNGKNYAVTVGEDATVVRTHFYNTVTGAIPNMADVQGVAVWDFGAAKIALRMQSDLMPYSSDASLSDLQVNAATVSGFVAGTMSYDVLLDVGTTTVPPVTYTITDAGATAVLTDATDLFGDLAARTTTVVVTAADGTEATYTIVFTVDNTGLDNSMSTKLTLYPVPASNVLNIKGMNGINSIEIINVVGNVVKRMNVESEMMSIDISNLSSGVYFIRANESTYRFIKK